MRPERHHVRMRRGAAARASIAAACAAGAITVGIPAGLRFGAMPAPQSEAALASPDLVATASPDGAEAIVEPDPAPPVEMETQADRADDDADDDDDQIQWFNGRPVRPARQMRMIVTAYSPDERSCGRFADGITASGYSVWTNGMKLAAADTRLLPFGSLITVPGYDDGAVLPVLDRGGLIKGRRLDMLFPTHEAALAWGVQELDVTVWEYADEGGG